MGNGLTLTRPDGIRESGGIFGGMIRLTVCVALVVFCVASNAGGANDEPLAFDASKIGPPNSGAALELWRPPGAGPFAAMVVLHGCGGVGEGSRSWAERLVGWGYAAAIVDSLRPRNIQGICDVGWLVPPDLRARDAFSAAAYLRTRPDIVTDRIGVIGFSHGGSSTISAVLTIDRGQPFQAAVAYYPYCGMQAPQGHFDTDLLILVGQDDDWNPAERCVNFVEANAEMPHAPTIKVYPGAAHGFDVPGLDRYSVSRHLMRENPAAAADSFAVTEAFLAARLKAK